jgi:hypothetical protein
MLEDAADAGAPADPEIRWLGELSRLEVRPGDRFVLQVDVVLTRDRIDRIREMWREFIGDVDGTKVLILGPGERLGVFGAADLAEGAQAG